MLARGYSKTFSESGAWSPALAGMTRSGAFLVMPAQAGIQKKGFRVTFTDC